MAPLCSWAGRLACCNVHSLALLLLCYFSCLQVLIHAGTGGVGQAGIQVARAAGCQVLSTAGSSAKRGVLRRLGLTGTANSRSTDFSDAVAIAAGGGVDVLLNSLTSPGMVAASLASLARHGRFAEISKRDIWSSGRIAQGG